MKKKLNSEALMQEFEEGSAFFRQSAKSKQASLTPTPEVETHSLAPQVVRDTVTPRYQDTTHDITVPRHHDTNALIEKTRRAVKQLGKEAATHRFTVEEKKALKSIERDFEDQGIRTSENEITRISINYMIEDYRSNGKDSILAHILRLLNS
jgi:hypothetical protein